MTEVVSGTMDGHDDALPRTKGRMKTWMYRIDS